MKLEVDGGTSLGSCKDNGSMEGGEESLKSAVKMTAAYSGHFVEVNKHFKYNISHCNQLLVLSDDIKEICERFTKVTEGLWNIFSTVCNIVFPEKN